MNTGGDAAEQMVRFYLEGVEVACRISGKGAEHFVGLLLNVLKNKEQTRGKARLNSMLKSGKNLSVFTIQKKDLAKFAKEAKSYGVLYSALINRQNKNLDGMVDIMVREEDASKIDRIVERFKLTTSNPVKVKTEVQKTLKKELEKIHNEQKLNEPESRNINVQTKNIQDIVKENQEKTPLQKEENINFNMAKTDQSPLSEPYSLKSEGKTKKINDRKSVKKELSEIKQEMQKKKDFKSKEKNKARHTFNKQNVKKKKLKSKEL